MDYIFIDTCIFESENYLKGQRIKQLLKLSQENHIKILISDITLEEIYSHFDKKVKEARVKLNKLRDEVRILKILDSTSFLKEIPSENYLFNLLKEKFDDSLEKAKVVKIKFPIIETETLFLDYFSSKPPFNIKDKKSEFPDAIVIKSIEGWCKENNQKCHFFSADKNFVDCKSEYILFGEDYKIYLENKLKKIANDRKSQIIEKISALYISSKERLEENLRMLINEKLNDESEYYDVTVLEIHDINVVKLDVHLDDYQITAIHDNIVLLEAKAEVNIEIQLEIDDANQSWYDDEDREWHYMATEIKEEIVNETYAISLEIQIPEAGLDFMDIEIDEINYGNSIIPKRTTQKLILES